MGQSYGKRTRLHRVGLVLAHEAGQRLHEQQRRGLPPLVRRRLLRLARSLPAPQRSSKTLQEQLIVLLQQWYRNCSLLQLLAARVAQEVIKTTCIRQ